MADSDCIIVHEQVVVPDASVVKEMVALPGEKEIKGIREIKEIHSLTRILHPNKSRSCRSRLPMRVLLLWLLQIRLMRQPIKRTKLRRA